VKVRLDKLLLDQGFYPSREKAQAAIMAGLVSIEQQPITKAGTLVSPETIVTIKGQLHPYVSRGGLKLAKALDVFDFDVKDTVVLDAGASTGGFTDVCLQNGASFVYAVDVGYGQLDWKLRQDDRVSVHERTNVRYLTASDFPQVVTRLVCDVSFISLSKVFPAFSAILGEEGEMMTLIKPQFEIGKGKTDKGIVKNPQDHLDVIHQVIQSAQDNGFILRNLTYSPIKGPEGNIEFLAHWARIGEAFSAINTIVESAHQET
jgi:23S rRNA (cytidine1920-2'-O)/16S rRNA (cytidine1409-2'-O)-methyltransferase